VNHVNSRRFQDYGKAEGLRGFHGFSFVVRHSPGCERDAVWGKNARQLFRRHRARWPGDPVETPGPAFQPGRPNLRQRVGGCRAVVTGTSKNTHGFRWIGEERNLDGLLIEPNLLSAGEDADCDRFFTGFQQFGKPGDQAVGTFGIKVVLIVVNEHQPVNVLPRQGHLSQFAVERQVKQIAQIEGILKLDHAGSGAAPYADLHFFGKGRQQEPEGIRRIRRLDRVPPGPRNDGQAIAAHGRQGKSLQDFNRFSLFTGPDDAALTEGGFHHPVIAGQRSGMGARNDRTRAAHVGLLNDDGFGGTRSDCHEPATISQALQITENDPGLVILAQVFHQVGFIHIQLVADTGEFAETKVHGGEGVDHHDADAATLGHHGNPAQRRFGSQRHEGYRQPGPPVHNAQSVRPDHPHPVLVEDSPHLPFQLAALRPQLAKAARLDHHALHPSFPTLLKDFGDRWGRNQHRSQIDSFRKVSDAWIDLMPPERASFRPDRVDRSHEAEFYQIADHGPAEILRGIRYSDHRHPLRLEKTLHALKPPCNSTADPSIIQR